MNAFFVDNGSWIDVVPDPEECLEQFEEFKVKVLLVQMSNLTFCVNRVKNMYQSENLILNLYYWIKI